ncbi:MAG: hypothetical protein U0X91_09010 [Spirosomataceae bacterium]
MKKLLIVFIFFTLPSYSQNGLEISNGFVIFKGATGTTPASGAGTRLMWIPSKKAFRAGEAGETTGMIIRR